jgi:hypothetical protein
MKERPTAPRTVVTQFAKLATGRLDRREVNARDHRGARFAARAGEALARFDQARHRALDDLHQRDGGIDLAVLLARDCDSDAKGPLAVSASRR